MDRVNFLRVGNTLSQQTELKPDKGIIGGSCNRTACQKPEGVFWYNHSTQKYYCRECAELINKMNRKDSMELFGHDLCTLDQKELTLITAKSNSGKTQVLTNIAADTLLKNGEVVVTKEIGEEEVKKKLASVTKGSYYQEESLEYTLQNFAGVTKRQQRDSLHVTSVRTEPKIGRNDPCPCGSGIKYKKCHL